MANRWLGSACLTTLLALAAPARAHAEAVDLVLVIAVDVSRSIDEDEARLQRTGYVEAFRNPKVAAAIGSGALAAVAVAYVEWAGAGYQRTVVDWSVLKDAASAQDFANRIGAAPRSSMSWTSISGAIDYAVQLADKGGFEAPRRVIDISGDGVNNNGRPAAEARNDAVSRGFVINGLPIINERPNFGRSPDPDLDVFYETQVIGGPGAFMIVAKSFDDFGTAILNKLIREIASLSLPSGG